MHVPARARVAWRVDASARNAGGADPRRRRASWPSEKERDSGETTSRDVKKVNELGEKIKKKSARPWQQMRRMLGLSKAHRKTGLATNWNSKMSCRHSGILENIRSCGLLFFEMFFLFCFLFSSFFHASSPLSSFSLLFFLLSSEITRARPC